MNFEWILAPFGQNITGSSQKKRGWRRPWHQACSGRVAFIEGVRLMAVRCPLDASSAGIAFLMAGLCDEFLCKHLSVFQGIFISWVFGLGGSNHAKKIDDF